MLLGRRSMPGDLPAQVSDPDTRFLPTLPATTYRLPSGGHQPWRAYCVTLADANQVRRSWRELTPVSAGEVPRCRLGS
jgi:hypothetical protein